MRSLILCCAAPAAMCRPCRAEVPFRRAETLETMRRVAEWQMANLPSTPEHEDLNWPMGALYAGMVDWAELAERELGDDRYYRWLVDIGSRNRWQPDKRFYHADDIAVSQTFLELYRKYGNREALTPTLARAEWIVGHPSHGTFRLVEGDLATLERWTWCDALFMAPPVYARLYRLTGERKFAEFMDREYRATYDYLFDREENLFYRDWRYFDRREANGRKVFWGRGNGWVLGGLAEILKELPRGDGFRPFYEELFVRMATCIASLQQPDGFWHASLLDPASYPSPETSCTAFVVYALAYGLNEGLLDREVCLPAVVRGWEALLSVVDAEGKLGFVQPIGADPRQVTREMTEVYGVGAFLMAGCEICRMAGLEADRRAAELVARMTVEEKIAYISGYTSFSLRPMPHLGIPEIRLADGPQGIRNHAPHSTLYPAGILTAATWNRDLVRRLGRSLGRDARARGVHILLGPGVNIYRSPLCGRNFEYMGEDPYLASEAAREYILGVQSEGVIATIKHFAANNQEWNRHHVSSDVDERTLHEIYFPAFRKAVRAGVGAVMNSYNLLNGVHATENRWLNCDVLRDRWGFDGILMSDWTSVYSAVGAANAGLDLEMPKGRYMNADNLLPAIASGRVTEQTLDTKVRRILRALIERDMLDREQTDPAIPHDDPASRETALELAREGIVLLKNQGGTLPLRGCTAIMGPLADRIATGGGSGFVSPFSTTTVAEGLKALQRRTILLTDDILYEDITDRFRCDSGEPGFRAEYFDNQTFSGEPVLVRTERSVAHDWGYGSPDKRIPADHFSVRWEAVYRSPEAGRLRIRIGGDDGYRLFVDERRVTGDWGNHSYSDRETEIEVEADREYRFRIEYFDNISTARITFAVSRLDEAALRRGLAQADNAVFCTGFDSMVEGEGFDRPFALPEYQEVMIRRVAELCPRLAVVLHAGGGVDLSAWEERAQAIVMAWYPGQEGGRAVAEILAGRISPSGRLPISIERRLEDNPCAESYYENLKGSEYKRVEYSEGVFTGYRGYDRTGVAPRYAFGFGLSYTTFAYGDLKVERCGPARVRVSFDVTNTGGMDAAEVAQVYVHDVEASVPRPLKELKEYEKIFLRRGETRRVTVELDEEAFAFFDTSCGAFRVEPGVFGIWVGSSSDELPLRAEVELTEETKFR